MEGFASSRPIKGKDSGWQPVSLWFKTGSRPAQRPHRLPPRQLRADHRGRGWCTGISFEPQLRPPLNADYVFGPIEESTTPVGLPAAVAIGLLLVMALARYGRLPADVPTREWLRLDGILIAILAVKMICAAYFKYEVDIGSYADVGAEARRGRGPPGSTRPATSPTTRPATCTSSGASGC
jgi:hypothetical protein